MREEILKLIEKETGFKIGDTFYTVSSSKEYFDECPDCEKGFHKIDKNLYEVCPKCEGQGERTIKIPYKVLPPHTIEQFEINIGKKYTNILLCTEQSYYYKWDNNIFKTKEEAENYIKEVENV